MDSTVAIALLKRLAFDVQAIEIDYAFRSAGERIAAQRVIDKMGIKCSHINYSFNGAEGLKRTGVQPSSALMVSMCDVFLRGSDIQHLVIGTIKEDWSSPEGGQVSIYYYRSLEKILSMHCSRSVHLHLPFYNLTKNEIAKLGVALNAPLEQTWSCSSVGLVPCAECRPCREAAEAIASLDQFGRCPSNNQAF